MAETEYPTGRCEGCGDTIQADHGDAETGYGHTVPEHDIRCDPDRGCAPGCPVPVACGPINITEATDGD